ncbi:DUF7289 family protein [Natronococcus occultus]|uniref:Archaeal flagellin-like protein n=1 Tax=Natronococcus occultus SP4 TaxID=694430 RepID=L0JVC3_9EURY|nr:hypothetical protein [Natronococcus occultus]AGB36977.1 hypothetical protein Natoc_1139 [Natronococcus occultus SP4]
MIRNRDRSGRSGADDRAVSELLSFVLVFGLVFGSVAVLSVAGLGIVDDHREAEQLRTAERGVTSLAAELEDLARNPGLERRSGVVPLGDGSLTVGGGTELGLVVDGDPVGDPIELGAVAYRSGDETVAYDGGAVVRADEETSRFRTRPPVSCRGGTATVSLVQVESADPTVRTGGQAVVTARVEDRTVESYAVEDAVSMTVVETDYERAWRTAAADLEDCEADRLRLTVTTVSIAN